MVEVHHENNFEGCFFEVNLFWNFNFGVSPLIWLQRFVWKDLEVVLFYFRLGIYQKICIDYLVSGYGTDRRMEEICTYHKQSWLVVLYIFDDFHEMIQIDDHFFQMGWFN